MAPTVYLISGANRGIGYGLAQALASRDDVIVFAGARDPAGATALHELEASHPGKVYTVKLVACDEKGNRDAVDFVKQKAGRLDVVIANAAINQWWSRIVDTPAEELRKHFDVNTVGTLVLFQASFTLLNESTQHPKFIIIGARGGSITEAHQLSITPYQTSKAAVHFLARKLHFEHEKDGLVVFPICPGLVDTDMGQDALSRTGEYITNILKNKSIGETATLLLGHIDKADRETYGGQFWNFDGTRIDY